MCQRALTRKRTFWGGGALEVGDLCLLEDGGERGGALLSEPIEPKTTSKGRGGDGRRASVSMGADTKANTWAWWQESGHYPAAAGKQAGLSVLRAWSLRLT